MNGLQRPRTVALSETPRERRRPMEERPGTEHVETLIVGGGQAGLATGYFLKQQGHPFLILDAGERVGDAWRNRWESLRLFTPARFDRLPGFPFPAPSWSFPSKDEMGDYLEEYVQRFDLPVRTGVKVERLAKEGERFVITSPQGRFEAENVVVATGACQIPKIPGFAGKLSPNITQLHSKDYQSPSQLRDGDVLVVGVGNSGAEISKELSKSRRTLLAGKESGHLPVRHGSIPARIGFRVFRFLGHRVLTEGTPIGRKMGPKLIAHGDPLIRVRPKDLAAAGIERVPRVAGVEDGLPVLDDGRVLDVANVIWCTGYRSDFGWIDLPVLGTDGEPIHDRGVARSEPGLSFVGLVFQYSFSSDVLPGMARDHAFVANHISSRAGSETRALRELDAAR
jgi:putative flavoprotein involved in K+ transport